MTSLPRAAILHPELRGGAGSEATAVWLAQAIGEVCRVTLVSMGPVDLPKLNGIYGTSLSAARTETVSIPIPRGLECRFDALRSYRLGRWAKKNACGFDLMISSYNVMDFGKRGIQFIADFSFDDGLRREIHPSAPGLKSLLYRDSPLRSLYLGLGRRLAGQSPAGWRGNLTLANSRWTRDVLERRLGLEAGVLYPPVLRDSAPAAWDRKENGFVVMARMAPEKQVERTIAILDAVRRAGHDVHLHVLGREDHRDYTENVRELCRERGGWACFEGLVVGERKKALLAGHRYGLSGCRNEAFGIGVAEMAAAGSLAWVPRGGGQVEIVDNEDLIYDSDEDAARKICRVLEDADRQAALGRHLGARAALFGSGRFVEEARRVVGGFLNGGVRP
jgi:glycosyltransferase involved in cell wall biosynthesis